ncbi:MAG: alkaline phosphatase family protein [Chloroflexota bacterium]
MWKTLVNRYARGYRGVLMLLAIVVVVAVGAAAVVLQRGGSAGKTVFVIVMENQNGADIVGNPAAPYINSVLLPQASYAARYFNPPGIHPSLPNYLWMEAGTNFGVTQDVDPSDAPQSTSAHLVTLLANAGISWRAYEEGISGSVCPLTSEYPYAVRHNPFIYFNDVTGNLNPHSSNCIAHERPYTQLSHDLQHDSVARYNFITPNVCDDMHDSCAPISDPIKQGDTWLSKAVPPILNSDAYTSGGVLFIVWDEAESGDGPIPMMALSPDAKGHGYRSTVLYTHSSLLRTLEDIFGVSPYLGDAAKATPLRDLFTTYP